MTAPKSALPAATEDELLTAIVGAAGWYQWRVHHDRRSDLANPQWGSHPGFPDLVLIRNGVVIFAELKGAKEELREDQWAWMKEMPPDSHALRYRLWRPADQDAAIAELAKP